MSNAAAHVERAAAGAAAAGALPRHVAIIMDGNGRWAKARGLPRAFGHREGVEALRRTVEAAGEMGIAYLTVFGFSSENWRRPRSEVDALFDLLRLYVGRDLDRLAREGVRIKVVGHRDGLPADVLSIIDNAQARTRDNDRLKLTIAFNYGGRQEILVASRDIARAVARGELDPERIDEATFRSFIGWGDTPDPDLLIRTSGEQRLSNFLLWQCAYTELVFEDAHWPDFGKATLASAIADYGRRERRYGGHGGDA